MPHPYYQTHQEGDPVRAPAAGSPLTSKPRRTREEKARTRSEQIAALEEIWYPFETPSVSRVDAPSALQSLLPVATGEVTIVTQCSLDRLDRLEVSGWIQCELKVEIMAFDSATRQICRVCRVWVVESQRETAISTLSSH